MENQKIIGGISIERWKRAFAAAAAIAMDQDYFSDILFFDLYPGTHEEAAKIDEDDEDAQCDVYNSKWEYADKAFKEVFGVERHGDWNI
jgi:hypothetical protein